ncbi:YhgE/Pip family protein [Paenibacillus taiwanensis]|uniref:YhgE/Pip family protein n=1 Tax=Paenibacillus taiwanensis TaxID=401638 RepID=UPI0004061950|nr:YhgE/Pip domain-containing protein [Paenibacillus taiwanensis]
MKGTRLFAAEWGRVFRNPKLLIPVIAVIMVPLMYSGLFLGTFWDPYAKLQDLPVAIVNADQGTTFEGKTFEAGKELSDELKKRKDFDFQFVDEKEAEEGLKADRYYMTITIPSNFSKQATTLLEDEPKAAELLFRTNEGHNFLAAQIGGTAVKQVNAEISKTITEAYTTLMFEQVEKVADGLQKAGDGATKLHDGTKELADGTKELKTNMAKLADGALQLKQGTAPLSGGIGQLNKGAGDLKQGATTLSGGLGKLSAAHNQLEQGAAKAQQGVAGLEQGLNASAQGSAKLTEGAKALAGGLQMLVKANPALAQDPGVKQLLGASQAVLQGAEQLNEGQQKLVAGAGQLKAGQGQLVAGMNQFGTKLNEAAAGGKKLAAGADQLAAGTSKLQSGVGEATKAIGQLANGAKLLDEGTGKLQDGVKKLNDGSDELATKLTDAADEASAVKSSDARIKMYAEPVKVVESAVNEVPNYGTGFAPYFLSLGLFVGALILTIVLPLVESPDPLANGWSRFFSKTMLFISVGVIQALLADWIMLSGLGLEVKSVGLFITFSIFTSMTFMLIIQSLVTVFDNPGRFIAIVLLILQLVSCGGTFPMELTPSAMQAIGPWLPMTYTVNGFKAVISSGDFDHMWSQTGVLAIYMAAFAALTLGFFISRARKSRAEAGSASLSA